MSKGEWSISLDLFNDIEEFIPKRSKILEFGSGQGTKTLVDAGYDMFSIEEDIRFIKVFHDQYCHAEIKDGWYDLDKVRNFLNGKYFHAVLIDGPAHGERLKILDSGLDFNDFKVIIVDDIERKEDAELFSILSKGKQFKQTGEYGIIFND